MTRRWLVAASIATAVWLALVGLGWAAVMADVTLPLLVVLMLGLAVIWSVASRPGRG